MTGSPYAAGHSRTRPDKTRPCTILQCVDTTDVSDQVRCDFLVRWRSSNGKCAHCSPWLVASFGGILLLVQQNQVPSHLSIWNFCRRYTNGLIPCPVHGNGEIFLRGDDRGVWGMVNEDGENPLEVYHVHNIWWRYLACAGTTSEPTLAPEV